MQKEKMGFGQRLRAPFKNVRLPRWLEKIRRALPQQVKMTLLTIVGFTAVFFLIGAFTVNQFQDVMYGNATARVQRAFSSDQQRGGDIDNSSTTDYTTTLKEALDIPKENQVYLKSYSGRWFMFYLHDDVLAYADVTVEHQAVEAYQTRLLWIFALSEVALLLMSLALSQANMRPIMRSWRQQRTFVADAAHEFKTPMTVIQGNMERMLEHPNDTVMDQVEGVANTLTEVRHLNNLVGDLLTLAQADADVPLFVFREFDLAETAREVGDIFKFNAEERQQELVIDFPETLPVIGDSQRLRQLLVILTDNAQKYAGENATVTVRGRQVGNNIKISVIDTGQGVSDADKQHLFDRFYRVDKARSRSTGGHGLGLSIAKWVVTGHRGTINVVDTKPHGTTFNITLPRSQKLSPELGGKK
jgi:two-component system sensor histidine kinase CiaH